MSAGQVGPNVHDLSHTQHDGSGGKELRSMLKSPDRETRAEFFARYETEILGEAADAIAAIKLAAREHGCSALMCYEADYRECHRAQLAEAIARDPGFAGSIVHV